MKKPRKIKRYVSVERLRKAEAQGSRCLDKHIEYFSKYTHLCGEVIRLRKEVARNNANKYDFTNGGLVPPSIETIVKAL